MSKYLGLFGPMQPKTFVPLVLYSDMFLFAMLFLATVGYLISQYEEVLVFFLIFNLIFLVLSIYVLVRFKQTNQVVSYLNYNYALARINSNIFSFLVLLYIIMVTMARVMGSLKQFSLVW